MFDDTHKNTSFFFLVVEEEEGNTTLDELKKKIIIIKLHAEIILVSNFVSRSWKHLVSFFVLPEGLNEKNLTFLKNVTKNNKSKVF